jgi:hypothetical protein
MSRRYSYYSSNDSSWGSLLGYIALLIVLCIIMSCCNSANVSSEREKANMVYIEDGYCYDSNTKIIYRETIIGQSKYSYDTPMYSPYVNENGNYCKYENGEWVEFIND